MLDNLDKIDRDLILALDRHEHYLQFAEFRRIAAEREKKEYDSRLREEGFQQGIEQGAVLSMRKAIVNVFAHRFPDQDVSTVNATLEQIADEQKLNSLFSVAMECSSVEDFLEQIK